MIIRQALDADRQAFDEVAQHPLQSWAWGEFKSQFGTEVVRLAAFDGSKLIRGFQFTLHQVPKLNWQIGYYPRGQKFDDLELQAIQTLVEKYNLIFVKTEADFSVPAKNNQELAPIRQQLLNQGFVTGRPQFTPYSFQLDLTESEANLLANCKSKTRYNIRVAQKHDVKIFHDNSDAAFQAYLDLWEKTTKRQQFYAHTKAYQEKMWQVMSKAGIAHILRAEYQGKTISAWIVFVFNHRLYYPYGASSREHREVMANNLLAWEAIRFGKKNQCHTFDMWGSLGPKPDKNDPWYGFHRFKKGYGGELVEFVGTYDYVADQPKYQIFQLLDKWRWRWLRFRSKLGL